MIASGMLALLDGISTVRNFNLTDTQNNPPIRASNTQSGTARRKGIKSWSGSYGSYGATPLYMPGEFFDFKAFMPPPTLVPNDDCEAYSGSAIVDSVAITWNWTSGEVLSHVVNFSGHLGLSLLSAQQGIDATDVEALEVCGTKWQYSIDGTTWYEWPTLAQAVLTITAANQAYVNSQTACETGRVAGPIDWTLALTEQNCQRLESNYPTKGNDYQFKGFVDATDHWRLKWGKLKDFTNIQADVESGAIIGRTANIEMNGIVGSTVGRIYKPGYNSGTGAGIYWPAGATGV